MRLYEASLRDWHGHVDRVSQLIARSFATGAKLDVLEAGCGSATWLQFPPGSRLTGIDISSQQLERNTRLDVRIQGDLQTYQFEAGSFDVVVCWDVIEHLDEPAAALDRLVHALRPNGLLVLGFPNRASLKGLLTRALPHKAHVWIYRWFFGMHDAGRDDKGPFPTPMRRDMDRGVIKTRLGTAGADLVEEILYESPMMAGAREKVRLIGTPWKAFQTVLRPVFGDVNVSTTDCIMVFRRVASS